MSDMESALACITAARKEHKPTKSAHTPSPGVTSTLSPVVLTTHVAASD